jgi:hypothetical protein
VTTRLEVRPVTVGGGPRVLLQVAGATVLLTAEEATHLAAALTETAQALPPALEPGRWVAWRELDGQRYWLLDLDGGVQWTLDPEAAATWEDAEQAYQVVAALAADSGAHWGIEDRRPPADDGGPPW